MRRWGLVVLVCLLSLFWNVFFFWASPWGGKRVAGLVERLLGSIFQGEILLSEIRVDGIGRILVGPVLFVDPRGTPAASVRGLEIRISTADLLLGRAVVEVDLDRPHVRVAADDPGAGLGAVFLPEIPPSVRREPTKEPRRPPLPLRLAGLRLVDGAFLLSTEAGERMVLVREIGVFARGLWQGVHAELELGLDARVLLPVRAPLHLDLRASLDEWKLLLSELLVALGGTELRAVGEGDIHELWGDVRLVGVVDPAHARVYGIALPGRMPLRVDVHLARESRAEVRLEPRSGGRILVDVRGHDFLRCEGGIVLQNADPSAFWQGAPRARLSGRGSFAASVVALPELAIALQLDPDSTPGPGRVRARLRGAEVEVEEFELELPGARVHSSGSFDPRRARLDLRLEIHDLARLSSLLESAFAIDLPPIAGEGKVDLRLSGALADPDVELQGRFGRLAVEDLVVVGLDLEGVGRLEPPRGRVDLYAQSLRWRGLALERVRIRARRQADGAIVASVRTDEGGTGDAVVADLFARPRAGRIEGDARVAASGVGAMWIRADAPTRAPRPQDRFELDLRLDPLDPSRLGRWLALRLPPAQIRARLKLRGTVAQPRLDATVLAAGLRPLVDRGPEVDAHLVLSLRDDVATVAGDGWQDGAHIAQLAGSFPFSIRRALRDPARELASLVDSADVVGELRARGIDLSAWTGIEGLAAAEIRLRGPLRAPRGEARMEVSATLPDSLGPVHLAVAARSTASSVHVDLSGSLANQPPLRLVVRIDEPLARAFAISEKTVLSAYWDLPALDLSALPLKQLVAGTLVTFGRLEGPLHKLVGTGVAEIRDLVWVGKPLGSVEARTRLGEQLEAEFYAIDPEGGTFEASATTLDGMPFPPWRLAQSRVRAGLRAESFSLAPLSLLPALAAAEGKLDAELSGVGRPDSIFPEGRVEVRDGVVQVVGALRYDRIGMRARLAPNRVELDLLEAHGGPGIAVVRGTIEGRPDRFSFDLGLRASDFPVGGAQGVVARVGTRGRISGRVRERLEAMVELESARVELPTLAGRELHDLAEPEDVVYFERREERRRAPPLPLVVRLDVAGPVEIRAPDLSLDARVGLLLRSSGAGDLLATGEATTPGGQAALFGRTFVVEESRVRWSDSPLGNPDLSLRARFEGVGAIAWIDVGGTVREPTIQLRSEPPLSEGEIALLIASGGARPAGGLTPTEGEPVEEPAAVGAAASLLGSVAADRFLQALGPGVPIDVLTVEAVDGRTLLQAGTYVGPRLYLGYARNLFPEPWENANEVRLTYRLSRTLAVQSNFGDAANGGVDLVWVEQFPTATQRERRREAASEPARGSRDPGCDARTAVLACGP